MAAVDVYLNSEGSDFPSVAEYLPAPDVPSAKNRLNVTDASILLPNEARATILGGSFGFTCPGPEAELIMSLVTNCGGELSVIPSHLIRGSAQELVEFVTQKWQERGLEEFAPVLYAPSQVCTDWSSLVGLERTASKHQKAWYSMSMIELCQRILYVNKLNPTTLPKPPPTHQIKAEPADIPSQSSELVIIKGNIFKPRRAKPLSSSHDFDHSQLPVRCKTKLASLVNSETPAAGSVNCKQFKKTNLGSGSNYRAIPTLVPLVPLHQIRPSQVIPKVDPLDVEDF
ncbi:hypothetical protein DSO57_1023012 [Entomophthora muscae]|uniref:Uncharacterized protein n=1 Tax=Entomophthora muscae TaxID=34485 RepID=A0ACC2SS83_9FUNG|nr:hypothetical protein DSO57_1023012 [Entomophthora muscae]